VNRVGCWLLRVVGKIFLLLSYGVAGYAKTLFVCGGNTGRSYMAEAIARVHFQHESFSRGLDVQARWPEEHALVALAEIGIQHKHQAHELQESDVAHADLVLTMTKAQRLQLGQLFPGYSNKVKTMSECALGFNVDVWDAYGQSLAYYRQRRDQIFHYEAMMAKHSWLCV